ncbi:MAG TPA: metallophosphoesterase [Terriglobia bacterium]|jgi:3',5'-cyclic AMP phosphodiesterase CpdA|nr:metallophosphoesterase [Terriglobia bacterium]
MSQDSRSPVLSTIVHLSDIHFGPSFDIHLGEMLLSVIPQLEPDIILVTGDLADSPRPRWLRNAAEFLRDMLQACEKISRRQPTLLVIPGNHDRKLMGNLTLGAVARRIFDAYFGDLPERINFPTWKQLWRLALPGRRVSPGRGDIPSARSGGLRPYVSPDGLVIVMPYDSNHVLWLARGRVKPDQILETSVALQRPESMPAKADPLACRIALVHHHPVAIPYADSKSITNVEGFLVLENAGTFMRELVKNDFDLILHGHKHYSNFTRVSYQLNPNESGDIGVLAAGTPTVKGGNEYGKNSYNVIRVFGQGRVQIEIWEYGGAQGLQYASHTPYPFELLDAAALKRRAFRRNFRAHQLKARTLTMTQRIYPDGRAEVTYEVEGLMVTNRSLRGYQARVASGAGLVRNLGLDAESQMAGMTWEAVAPSDQGMTQEERFKALRRKEGVILFNRALGQIDAPISFRFGYNVVNGYAMSDREYELLYPQSSRAQSAGGLSGEPTESMAHVVWFPLEKLRLKLKLPSTIAARPFLDVARNAAIQRAQVIEDGILRFPTQNPDAGQWERDAYMRAVEEPRLRQEPDNTWGLDVDFPPVGCRYSINWFLPRTELKVLPDGLIAEAESFRDLLVRYRERRLKPEGAADPQISRVKDIFRTFYTLCRRKFPCIDSREKFDVVLITYDQQRGRLVVIEGLMDGEELTAPYWNLALKPGLGNAGSCFKTGDVCLYLAREATEKFSYYVPVEQIDPHKVLVSIPLDHPGFVKAAQAALAQMEPSGSAERRQKMLGDIQMDRKRQVVAVMNLGSTCDASSLRQLRRSDQGSADQSRQLLEELAGLSQLVLNKVWEALVSSPAA